jgi:hypothetical protein
MPTDDPSKLAADPPAPATADSSALARGATVATLIAATIAVLFMGLSLGYKVVHRAEAQRHGPAANAPLPAPEGPFGHILPAPPPAALR